MKIVGIIPARYGSTRFEGKPLVEIQGKSMIQRVYEQAQKAKSLSQVVVATDDARIATHVASFGGQVVMTSPQHQSGTDRCAEALAHLNMDKMIGNKDITFYGFNPKKREFFNAVVNIQGDEPFIDPTQIEQVVTILKKGKFSIVSLAKKLTDVEAILNPNIVKVVFTPQESKALYFSRSPIPYVRDTPQLEWASTGVFFKHIGIYGYTSAALYAITRLPKGHFEAIESLEQLRWLENKFDIGIGETDLETIGIDTPEDLEKIKLGMIKV